MRLLITLALLTFSLQAIQKSVAQNQVLVKNIIYDVPIINPEYLALEPKTSQSLDCWWLYNLEISKRWFFQKSIIDKVKNGTVHVYNDFGKLLDSAEIDKQLHQLDTVRLLNVNPPFNEYDTVIKKIIAPSEIHYLRFNESWYFDKKTYVIKKVINSYAPVVSKNADNPQNTTEFRLPLFWIKCRDKSNCNKSEMILTDFIYSKTTFRQFYFNQYWDNFVSISNDSNNRQYYLAVLFNAAKKGSIKVYHTDALGDFYNYSKNDVQPLKITDVAEILMTTETETLTRSSPPYEAFDTTITTYYKSTDIACLNFTEKWFLNKKTLEIRKKVIDVVPCIPLWESDEVTLRGFLSIFSVLFVKPYRCY